MRHLVRLLLMLLPFVVGCHSATAPAVHCSIVIDSTRTMPDTVIVYYHTQCR